MPGTTRTIRLELDEGHALRGRVREADAPDQAFEGWLELLALLGALVDGAGSGDAPVPPTPTERRKP